MHLTIIVSTAIRPWHQQIMRQIILICDWWQGVSKPIRGVSATQKHQKH